MTHGGRTEFLLCSLLPRVVMSTQYAFCWTTLQPRAQRGRCRLISSMPIFLWLAFTCQCDGSPPATIPCQYALTCVGLQDGVTCMMKAAEHGHVQVLELLLEKRADVNATRTVSEFGTTTFWLR